MKILEWETLRECLQYSNCVKRNVAAGTYVKGSWVQAVNSCTFEGSLCPRLKVASGESYELCQTDHAEAKLIRLLEENNLKSDGIVWISGHHFICENCFALLKSHGVIEIRVSELLRA